MTCRAAASAAAVWLLLTAAAHAQGAEPAVPLLDVPFISQSEALCGGAAAAMILRYWGERGVDAESFAHLLDRSAAGIRTTALVADLIGRGWQATAVEGREALAQDELSRGRPVLTLIEDRPGTYHYIVVVAWHERGVVFHDPSRAPFRVMSTGEFDRRWRRSDRWMAVVLPPMDRSVAGRLKPAPTIDGVASTCERLVAEGVGHAQANDLDAAERVLTSALTCPGPAAARELAGVRLLQKRWPEVGELASTAVAEDARDTYAWKLLATARFLQDDRLGALDAWNVAGEPRLDLVRIDGLSRTRHRIVERLVGAETGDLLTTGEFLRARRRLDELPSAVSARLDYVPVPSGLAELRGAVAERPVLPRGRISLAALGLSTLARREARVAASSPTGGGERITAAWRFWPGRPRVGADIVAPAPWGGTWGVVVFSERQPFTDPAIPDADRAGSTIHVAEWATARLRWEAGAGIDRWRNTGTFGRLTTEGRLVSADNRLDGRVRANAWFAGHRFGQLQASMHGRSSTERRGFVGTATASVEVTSDASPHELWSAGDTGHARPTLLRAHPVLDEGRLRVDRLGRTLVHLSVEAQHWWPVAGVLRVGGALFTDMGRTSRRLDRPPLDAVDAGAGARLAFTGMPGMFRVDLAKGLKDGATALSFVYEP